MFAMLFYSTARVTPLPDASDGGISLKRGMLQGTKSIMSANKG